MTIFPDFTPIHQQAESALAFVESSSGRRFGDARKPLLLAVRSGARASMPGMMDTVLNLGLNETWKAEEARVNLVNCWSW